ncbi:FUSC family protein [Streptomyces sp. NPDC058122]|uniref:FUSC family protein n=1 Tax=Streptomyces sp. NPDC058122 TaxID=3346349 RepID=UPI0036E38E71
MLALALALPPAALLGIYNRFGDQGVYAPTTVIFVLAYGTFSGEDIAHRLGETAVGAAIGIAANALLLPPVHLRGVEESLTTLARESTSLLRLMADDLREDYGTENTARWRARFARISASVEGLRNARIWSRESYRLNPGHRLRRKVRRSPSIDHDAYWERFVERVSAVVDNLAAAADTKHGLAQPPPDELALLAQLLSAVADVCEWDRIHWGLLSDKADRAERDAAQDRAEQALTDLTSGLTGQEPNTMVTVGALIASGRQLLSLLRTQAGIPGGQTENVLLGNP